VYSHLYGGIVDAYILLLAVGVTVIGLAVWRGRRAAQRAAALREAREAMAAAALAAAQAEAERNGAEKKAKRAAAKAEATRVIAAEMERVRALRAARIEEAERNAREAARRAVLEANQEAAENAAREAAKPAGFDAARAATAHAAAAPVAPTPPASFKTPEQTLILVTDDSKVVRLKAGRFLAQHGYRVAYGVDGLDAIRQAEAELPDLVVTDIEMPNMAGFGLTRHLRGNARTAHVPIVMISSADAMHREATLREGVGLVLGKPFPEEPLLEHIRSFRCPLAAAQVIDTVDLEIDPDADPYAYSLGWAPTEAGAFA